MPDSVTGVGPRGSWLALSDGRVGSDVILNERLGVRDVVLASCASAHRWEPDTWGSLATAFLASGSRHVLAALLPVDDRATREFVLRFYAEREANDPATALANVQRAAAARGEPVLNWAPFVVLGLNQEAEDK